MSLKKLIWLIAGILIIISTGKAQQSETSLVNYPTGRNPNVIVLNDQMIDGFNYWNEKFSGHWSGIYMGLNSFTNTDYSAYPEEQQDFLNPNLWRSNSVNINLLKASIGLQHTRNTIGLVTGLGMEIQTYSLDRNTSIEAQFSRVEPVKLYFDDNQKSKLSSTYINIPLLLEFQVPVRGIDKRFYFSTGVIAKVRLNTHTKIKYRQEDQKFKLKTPGNFYINDVTCAGTVRIGYGKINLFATYDLQPLFEKDKGPVLYPFSVGTALLTF